MLVPANGEIPKMNLCITCGVPNCECPYYLRRSCCYTLLKDPVYMSAEIPEPVVFFKPKPLPKELFNEPAQ
jgi:hypothetical protein